MNKAVKIVIVLALVVLLMLVRAYGTKLLYDPFIRYFNHDYLSKPIPEYDTVKLFLNLWMRYFLNMLISLLIIYVVFQKWSLVVFSVKFYLAALFVLSIVYYLLLQRGFENGYLIGFYVRRFLIHPVFVLILLPAFYYQRRLTGNND